MSSSHEFEMGLCTEGHWYKEFADAEKEFQDFNLEDSEMPNKAVFYSEGLAESQRNNVKELSKAKQLCKKGQDAQMVPPIEAFFENAEYWRGALKQV